MTTEERVLRLENAFATLSELAANAQSGIDKLTGLIAAEKARTDALVQLVSDHDGRSETQMGWINSLGSGMAQLAEAQTNSETKIAALVDAHIKTEETLTHLGERVDKLGERVDKLAETVERYISEGRNGQS